MIKKADMAMIIWLCLGQIHTDFLGMALSLSLQADGASSRFFRNPFVANASEGARLVSREWILQSLRTLGTKIASRKIPKDEFEDGVSIFYFNVLPLQFKLPF